MQKCKATTRAGKPCRRPAMRGSEFCHAHTLRRLDPDATKSDTKSFTGKLRSREEGETNGWGFFDNDFVYVAMPIIVGSIGAAVYLSICAHAGNDPKSQNYQICWPSRATIAFEAGCSIRSVDKYLAILAELNIIHIQTRYVLQKNADGETVRRNKSNLYSLVHRDEWKI